jgi:HEAT repeat protein
LEDEELGVRQAVAQALGQLKDSRAVGPLIQRLGDEDSKVREAVAQALGQLKDSRAVEPLIQRLWLGDDDWRVRRAAVQALGQLKDSRAVEALIQRLGDENKWVRQAAVDALVAIGEQAIDPLIQRLGNENLEVCQAAALALEKLGEPLGNLLVEALQNNEAALQKLVEKKDSRAVEPIIQRLGNGSSDVRQAAALALGQLINPHAVSPLIQRLEDEELAVRQAAALALGQLEDPRAVTSLIQGLADENSGMRRIAAWSLGQIKNPRAVTPLIQRLGDEDLSVRQAAAKAISTTANALNQSPLSYTSTYFLDISWSPAYWQKTFSNDKPYKAFIKIIQFSPQYWFYLFLVGISVLLVVVITWENMVIIWEKKFNHLTAFSGVILLPIITLLGGFFIVAIVAITPWITGIVGAILVVICLRFWGDDEIIESVFSLLISILVFFATYLFKDLSLLFAISLIFDGLIVVLTLLFIGYLLGFIIVLKTRHFRPWLDAKKVASSWICKSDCTRYTQLGSGLPWLVRWSGRFLAVEVPKKHDDFADYFVCRTCGKNRKKQAFYTGIDHIIGIIGDMNWVQQNTYQENGQTRLAVKLFPNAEGKARSADIDLLEIQEPRPGETIDYDYAINAVIIALSEDMGRQKPLKEIPVIIRGNPPLSKNSRSILANKFGRIKEV